jgi:hypothetical protein
VYYESRVPVPPVQPVVPHAPPCLLRWQEHANRSTALVVSLYKDESTWARADVIGFLLGQVLTVLAAAGLKRKAEVKVAKGEEEEEEAAAAFHVEVHTGNVKPHPLVNTGKSFDASHPFRACVTARRELQSTQVRLRLRLRGFGKPPPKQSQGGRLVPEGSAG